MNIIILPIAFLLDIIFGDPENFPHPVKIIGKFISYGERFFRKIFPDTMKSKRLGGLLLVVSTVFLAFFIPFLLLVLAYKISIILGVCLEIFFCYQIIAVKSMKIEAEKVLEALKADDLGGARKQLARIVGRDTGQLNEKEIIKATVETVSESTCDGVIAPLFFMIIGGAPLGFAYKAVNTLDSMIGYKNEKYADFGYFAAKIDDILNFIPARITGLLYVFAAYFLGYNGAGSMKILSRDRLKHKSPNSGHSEAAAAGALGILLGGDAFYFGKLVSKEPIGENLREPETTDISRVLKMFYVSSVAGLFIFCLFRFIVIVGGVF